MTLVETQSGNVTIEIKKQKNTNFKSKPKYLILFSKYPVGTCFFILIHHLSMILPRSFLIRLSFRLFASWLSYSAKQKSKEPARAALRRLVNLSLAEPLLFCCGKLKPTNKRKTTSKTNELEGRLRHESLDDGRPSPLKLMTSRKRIFQS